MHTTQSVDRNNLPGGRRPAGSGPGRFFNDSEAADTMKRRLLYRQLRLQIIILTLFVAIAPQILLGGVIYYQFSKAHETNFINQLKNLVASQSHAADVFLRERTTLLSMLVETHSFEVLSQQDFLAGVFATMNLRSEMLGLVDIGIIDDKGNHLAYVGPFDLKGLNYSEQPWFHEVMAKGRYISDVFTGFRRSPHFIIAIRGYSDQHSWILRATIDSEVFDGLVRTAQAGRMGDAYIVSHQGIYQTAPRFDGQVLSQSAIEPLHFVRERISVEKVTDGSVVNYYAGSWLKSKNWLFLIRQQADDQGGGLAQARNTEIIIISLAVVAIVLTTIFTTHLVVRHLESASQEMDALNAQLVQTDKLAALGKMAAGIAHEINNPLAVIGEKAGWMKDLLDDEEFQQSENLREYQISLDKIEEHVERARKITHNMLGFARRMEPRLDDVDINHVLDQTIDLLANHARINNITIQRHFQENLPVIASDQSQLQQVVLNLINNAIDAIGNNGNIDITTTLESGHIKIAVNDDGPGISKEQQRRIFDPFYSTKDTGHGTGLGLSISYTIIEKLGGTLSCQSEVGQGATFYVQLPVVKPAKK